MVRRHRANGRRIVRAFFLQQQGVMSIVSDRDRRVTLDLAASVIATATSPHAWRLWQLPAAHRQFADAVVRVAMPELIRLGFVVANAVNVTTSRRVMAERHVAIVCRDRADLSAAALAIRWLLTTRPRGQFVVDCVPPGPIGRWRGPNVPDDGIFARGGMALAAGDLHRADLLLGGLAVLTCLERRPIRPPLGARLKALRKAQRFALKGGEMHWSDAVPGLLELARDAEDELGVLTGACRWLRRHADAERAAVVDLSKRRLVAADGWTRADVARDGWGTPRAVEGRTVLGGPGVWREAEIRFHGERIGFVTAVGPAPAAEPLSLALQTVAALLAPSLRARLDALDLVAAREPLVPEIVGRSPAIASLRREISRAAAVPFPVLIEGESGAGKELVARALHRLSPRRDRRFSAVNCAALTDELVEAELFGHARGAFTGAVAPRPGLFEDAHAGTLFLDEVSELSARAQAKLLRAVQEKEVRRVGENAARAVDVRLIAATNVPLDQAVAAGRFRTDLRFRLAVVRLTLPPLRDRVEDVPLLAQTFWRHLSRETTKRAPLGADALAALCRHDWPGNVRELQNVMAALLVVAPERGIVRARHVVSVLASAAPGAPTMPLDAARRTFEQRAVATALARHAGRRAAAARELGLSRQGLSKAIKRLGLVPGRDRADVA